MCPVDKYVGGPEHAAMHLLYARFFTKALRDMGYLDFDEPFRSLVHQGIILGPDGNRMSKSRGNTVAPDEYVQKYGSDVFRTYLAFGFAYTEGGPWSVGGLQAIVKFTGRIERLIEEIRSVKPSGDPAGAPTGDDKQLLYALHYTIKSVTYDTDRFQFNTSIARLMELLNAIGKYRESGKINAALLRKTCENLLLLFSPFAPHFCEEMWEEMGNEYSIFDQKWPDHDPEALVLDTVEIAVQINGQVKFKMDIASDLSSDDVEKLVLADDRLPEVLAGRNIVKFIYVKGRLANIVAR
ncbi:MAG: class I tRNA ligase family protein, partial [Clostridiales bacterium]|nr:class I tRNA ligase family protein [Clostridiales bacterium]